MAVLTAIGLGLAAYGTIQAARAQRKQGQIAEQVGEASAEQQEWNARIAEVQAEDARTRGREAESQIRLATKQLIGSQRVGFAGQGLDLSVGSPVNVQGDTAYLGELDALTARANAAREAWGYQVESADRRMAGDVARRGGQAQAQAGRVQSTATLLGGAGDTLMALDKFGWGRKKTAAP